jgi:hypothetical protein
LWSKREPAWATGYKAAAGYEVSSNLKYTRKGNFYSERSTELNKQLSYKRL